MGGPMNEIGIKGSMPDSRVDTHHVVTGVQRPHRRNWLYCGAWTSKQKISEACGLVCDIIQCSIFV